MADGIDQILNRLSPGRFDAKRAANLNMVRDQVCHSGLVRTLTIERADVPDEPGSRIVEMAFASDTPVEHWFGMLELSMKPGAMRDARLKAGAPLLTDHVTELDRMVGKVESFTISGGKVRAKTRFSTKSRAEEIFQDVRGGIIENVSVGFLVHSLELLNEQEVRQNNAIPIYRSDDWEPYEISLVCVPADIQAGIGRAMPPMPPADDPAICPECEMPMDECTCDPNTDSTDPATMRALSTNTERKIMSKENETPETPVVETRSAELLVANEIREWGETFGDKAIAQKYVRENVTDDGKFTGTKEGFFAAVRAAQPPTVHVPPPDPATQALREGGIDAGNNPQLAMTAYRGGALKAFRGERHLERAHNAGMFFLAVLGGNKRALQFCQDKGFIRAHSGEVNATGGVLVPEELDRSIIDLRIQYGVFRRNANVAVMASDTLIRPRRTGGLTAYFTGGGDAATESTKSWDSITLVAKKLSVLTKYENELSEDAVINIGDDLTSEIAYAFTNKEDNCGFNGDGTSTYGGIVGVRNKLLNLSATRANISGLKVAGTGHNTWAELDLADVQGVVAILPQFARQSGNVKWYCSHEFYATVLMRLAQAVGGVTATEIQNGFGPSFFGIPVEITEVMPHTEANDQVCLLYGNLAQAATLGDRRGTTIAMTNSDSTDFAKGIMAIRGDTRFDIQVHDVGNATGTAADRAPGPIVGLLTAAS